MGAGEGGMMRTRTVNPEQKSIIVHLNKGRQHLGRLQCRAGCVPGQLACLEAPILGELGDLSVLLSPFL